MGAESIESNENTKVLKVWKGPKVLEVPKVNLLRVSKVLQVQKVARGKYSMNE